MAYLHVLPQKEFNIPREAFSDWVRDNIPYFLVYCPNIPAQLETPTKLPTEMLAVFSEQPSYEYLTALDDYWAELTDDGSYAAEQVELASVALEAKKIGFGTQVRAYLGYLCELNNFTPVQYADMLADESLAFCSQLLISGALESCKAVIDAYTPTSYFTEDMKTAMSSKLHKYIALAV